MGREKDTDIYCLTCITKLWRSPKKLVPGCL